jgi:CheY-like chemotaxis protein
VKNVSEIEKPVYKSDSETSDPWSILVADDVLEVQTITKMVLESLHFEGRKLQVQFACRGDDAVEFMAKHPDTAVILMDLIMEDDNAGLRAVKEIRESLGNWWTRIIIQSGGAFKTRFDTLVADYEVDGFIEKGVGGVENLRAVIVAALRTCRDLKRAGLNI